MNWVLFTTAFVLGCAHAFEGDHLAAVSVFVAGKPAAMRSLRFGFLWAVGHGLSLLLFGMALIGLRSALSPATSAWFERAVGVSLLALGIHLLYRLSKKGTLHVHTHSKGALWMGMLHGIAGTGAFVAESILLSAGGFTGAVAVTIFFSAGVLVAMTAYAFVLGRLLNHSSVLRTPAFQKTVQAVIGVAACTVGFLHLR